MAEYKWMGVQQLKEALAEEEIALKEAGSPRISMRRREIAKIRAELKRREGQLYPDGKQSHAVKRDREFKKKEW